MNPSAIEVFGLATLLTAFSLNYLAALAGAKQRNANLLTSKAQQLKSSESAALTGSHMVIKVVIDPKGTRQDVVATLNGITAAEEMVSILKSVQEYNTDYYYLPVGQKLPKIK